MIGGGERERRGNERSTYKEVRSGSCRSGSGPIKLFKGRARALTVVLEPSQMTPNQEPVQGSVAAFQLALFVQEGPPVAL